MIIYLYGLPGAGKTYIAQTLSKQLRLPVIKVPNHHTRLLYCILFCLTHPRLSSLLFNTLRKENSSNTALLNHKIYKLLIHAFAYRMKVNLKQQGIVDEGILQFILSIYERPITSKDLKPFIKYIGTKKDEQVYIITASKDVRRRRILERGRSPRDRFGKEYSLWLLDLFETNNQVVELLIKNHCCYQQIHNDDSLPSRQRNLSSIV